jgi:hypothetical protein
MGFYFRFFFNFYWVIMIMTPNITKLSVAWQLCWLFRSLFPWTFQWGILTANFSCSYVPTCSRGIQLHSQNYDKDRLQTSAIALFRVGPWPTEKLLEHAWKRFCACWVFTYLHLTQNKLMTFHYPYIWLQYWQMNNNKKIIKMRLNCIKLNEMFVIKDKSLKPKVLVQWLPFFHRIQDVLGWNSSLW